MNQQSTWKLNNAAKASPRGRFGGAFNSPCDRVVTFSINSLRARPRNISVNINFLRRKKHKIYKSYETYLPPYHTLIVILL